MSSSFVPSIRTKSIHVGVLSGITALDPREATDNVTGMILGQIYEPPYVMNAGSTAATPLLFAEPLRAEPSAGGRPVYSAAVRPGIVFSDGTPLTADVMAKSLRGSSVLQNKAAIDWRGERVFFTLNGPNPRFELTLTQDNCAIVFDCGAGHLLGTGPFAFAQRPTLRTLQGGQSIALRRNEHAARRQSIDEVVFRVYPPEKDGSPLALAEAFRRGEVDLTGALSLHEIARYGLTHVQPSLQPGTPRASSTSTRSGSPTAPSAARSPPPSICTKSPSTVSRRTRWPSSPRRCFRR